MKTKINSRTGGETRLVRFAWLSIMVMALAMAVVSAAHIKNAQGAIQAGKGIYQLVDPNDDGLRRSPLGRISSIV